MVPVDWPVGKIEVSALARSSVFAVFAAPVVVLAVIAKAPAVPEL